MEVRPGSATVHVLSLPRCTMVQRDAELDHFEPAFRKAVTDVATG